MLFQLFNSLRGFFTFTASYSNQVFKEPLSKEEEEDCIKRMQQGDKEARNDLIEHNLR
ncbi:MAG: RNA polymerase subunit sigma-70, partial [bacterium]|nr:RNA polymerase subunit sigma-70 [bacterium]